MQTRTYPGPSRAALLDELVAATGRSPLEFAVGPGDTTTTVRFPDDLDPARVDAVFAAHNPAALDAAEAQAQTRRRQARQAIVGYPDLAAPTNAQTAAAVKALCLAVAELYRTT
jgi:hypothetical protein